MKVVVAIDSFKGSLSSVSAGNAVKEAVLKVNSSAEVTVYPLADGGEGTVDALYEGLGGELQNVTVTGSLGDKVNAQYCILPDKVTAVMELASAAGITLVPMSQRNPDKGCNPKRLPTFCYRYRRKCHQRRRCGNAVCIGL